MKAEEFVEKLASISPSIEYLYSLGYLQEVAEEIRKSYFLPKSCSKKPIYDDPLVNLITNYDTSEFRLGLVTLGKTKNSFLPTSDKIHIGAIESDILVINPKSGEVELLDHGQTDYVMEVCAVSGNRFLDALFLFAEYEAPFLEFKGNLTKEQLTMNNESARKRAIECAEAAGIPAKGSIYETLLGCDCRIV